MWAECINKLSPFTYELKSEIPKFIKKAFNDRGVVDEDEITIPIRPVALLGTCTTDLYIGCPNMPEHHVENSQWSEGYFYEMGGYYWLDFDVVKFDQILLKLRMVFNEGSADCNDGMWGAVWERNSGELIVNILSTGDSEATVQAISKKHIELCKDQQSWFPFHFEERDDDPIPCMTMAYANDAMLEKIVGLAIRLCCVYRSAQNYQTHGYPV